MAHALDIGGRGHVAEHRNDRIAGHEVNQREGDGRNAERNRNQREQAASQVRDHFAGSRITSASESRLPFGYGLKPATVSFSTTTLSCPHSDTYGRSSA